MTLWMKIAGGVLGLLGISAGALVGAAQVRWKRPLDAPEIGLRASTDPAVIERGRYLVQGPAHCAGCHGDVDRLEEYELTGAEIPLSGGFEIPIPPGKLRPSNLTPCAETGIGAMSDEQLARALRYGLAHDGRVLFPIMPFANIADDDLVAIMSYLRSVEPVSIERAPSEPSLLGKVLLAYVIAPAQPEGTPPRSVTPDRSVAYGEYPARHVANCYGCHTDRDLMTGAFTGEPMAGGLELEHMGQTFVVPNITLEGEGSRIKGWGEADFIARMRTGVPSVPGTPMPWVPFSKMTDDDLAAIFAYLETVPSVDKDTGPPIQEK